MTKQEKYYEPFNQCLITSDVLVTYIKNEFLRNNFMVRSKDDKTPYELPNGKIYRYVDLLARFYDGKNCYNEWKIEIKDFCRMVYYNCTGLPVRYVNKLNLCNTGDLVIILRDNYELIKSRLDKLKEYHGKKDIDILEEFCSNGLCQKFIHQEKQYYRFIPYGNRLNVLMRDHINEGLSKRIKSDWENYKNEEQYIFNLEGMIPLPKLIQQLKIMS
jgi:hypothetical protein